jgi:hypothetical protein
VKLDGEQTVKDFIFKVKALKARPLTDYTKADIDEAWAIWEKLAVSIQQGGDRPSNLMEGRRWAEQLEQLEGKIVSF